MNSPLERLLDVLVKNRMAGIAVPVAGITVGIFIFEIGYVAPAPFDTWFRSIGFSITAVCAPLLVFAITVYVINWTRKDSKRRK